MTDTDSSEDDLFNFNTFQNVNTTSISAKGPNTNVTTFTFRNQLPQNFERQRYAESVPGQRSIYYRRETSPMSIHSTNNQQYYPGTQIFERQRYAEFAPGQRSMYYRRETSPMSIHSTNNQQYYPGTQNFERQRYAESAPGQRSMYYRRETSPMSIHSTNNIQYNPGMSSQQSGFNRRRGSPMSMRSTDSTTNAADIVFKLKTTEFHDNDFKMIQNAYHKLMKRRIQKRMENRRNISLYCKSSRRRFGDDSWEQGSTRRLGDDLGKQGSNSFVSSDSSDDNGSIKTYTKNISSSRLARIDLTDSRKTVRDCNILKDNSEKFTQSTFNHKFSGRSASVNNSQNFDNTLVSKQSNILPAQKYLFRNGFPLPYQRFNRSVTSSAISESSEKCLRNAGNNGMYTVKTRLDKKQNNNSSAIEEEDDIFSEITMKKSTFNLESRHKRGLDESNLPDKKRRKISSPVKNIHQNKKVMLKPNNVNPSNISFEFAKPTLPVRKSKQGVQEKLIAKSSQSLTDEPVSNKVQEMVQILQPTNLQEKSTENLNHLDQSETTQNSDVSMRPSFIKRKLFTQKLDVAEKANMSSDCINSPQSNDYSLLKEKNKARKLVANQSCLNREVQDDSNLIDLIHKIVPPDRMNITNQTTMNQTKNDVHNKIKKDDKDKWDVTSVISMCNDDDVSDTYTDEGIFEGDNTNKENTKNKDTFPKANPETIDKVKNNIPVSVNNDCRILLEKLPNNTIQEHIANDNLTYNNLTKNAKKARSFWNIDSESDTECEATLPRSNVNDILKKANDALEAKKQDLKNSIACARSQVQVDAPKQFNTINNTVVNNTVDSMRKFNISNLSIRSHRTSKIKKSCNVTSIPETKSQSVNLSKISVYKTKENIKEAHHKCVDKINLKTDVQNKNPIKIPKSKLNTGNEKLANRSRSTSQNKNKPKEETSKNAKQVKSPKNKKNKKSESKSKLEKTNENINNKLESKLETQKKSTSVKNKIEKQAENKQIQTVPKPNTKSDNNKNKKDTQNKSPKDKPKSKTDHQNRNIISKGNNPVPHTTKPNLNNTAEYIQHTTTGSGRPLRSCRISSQSRSIENLSSLHNNSSDFISLRSRVINLSNENIYKIKPRNRTFSNKYNSKINTRQSDVSFSLGSDENTPKPKREKAKRN